MRPNPNSKLQTPKSLKSPLLLSAVLLLAPALACLAPAAPGRGGLAQIKLPPGFSISMYTDKVRGARSLTLSPKGIVYVGTMGSNVYAVVDRNHDGVAEEVHTIASGLSSPNGVAWKDGSLYVAEVSRVLRFDHIDDHLTDPPKPVVVTDAFPGDGHHGWKFIRFGPDGNLYVPEGMPCNVCEKDNPIYGTITKLSAQGKPEIVERGIRNTVGFDWHPVTHELWFTDNGRDLLGDDSPPDELNYAPRPGMNFGFPYCHGRGIADPEFGRKHACSEFTPPAQELGPHVASLGMRFYTGTMFPESYRNQIFIAEHGSWNRSTPIGYRVTLVRLQGNKAVSYEPFAQGWLQGREAWGRPVDVQVMPDGALLVSDDRAGAIYRIAYAAKR
jgi:glucose/arabinose dehydrogenase